MRRREFIAGLGSAAAWPVLASSQQPPVIGILGRSATELFVSRLLVFRRGLNEAGFVEGRNVAFEIRLGTNDRWSDLAADLVRLRVSVIVTMGGVPAASAAKAATAAIPIVFTVGVDPVKLGLVSSLSRPSANVTGVTGLGAEIGPKRVELLHKVIPAATTIGLLVNPTSTGAETISRDLQGAARLLGLQSRILYASHERDFDKAFATLKDEPATALVVSGDSFFNTRSAELAELAIRYAMPTISQFRDFAAAGGLISYGSSYAEVDALAGLYVGRILKGEKPADLPVLQPTKFEFVINAKTARALGLTIPETLLATADEVIQ